MNRGTPVASAAGRRPDPPRARAGLPPGGALLACVLLAACPVPSAPALAGPGAPIQDNSFLVEEAYNQEPRVVQHIVTWARPRGGGAWELRFTQEWPLVSQRHQLSYTVPVRRLPAAAGGARGIGDVGVHYRLQALGGTGGPVAVAPRFTVLLSTGDDNRGLGAGAPGAQVNLPVSLTLSPRWVTHANAGATWLRRGGAGAGGVGTDSARRGVHLAQSLIWLPRPDLNLVLEVAWERSEAPDVPGDGDREESLVIAPGVRAALDLAGSLQVVPGLAVPIGAGSSRGEREVLLYLSLEHGF